MSLCVLRATCSAVVLSELDLNFANPLRKTFDIVLITQFKFEISERIVQYKMSSNLASRLEHQMRSSICVRIGNEDIKLVE